MTLPTLDHAVINVHYQLDQAQTLFRALGFHLTERGFHSLGSINHSMMFLDDYLELIGLPEETKGLPPARPEVLSAPVGINGLVFKTDDADETYQHLKKCGYEGGKPTSFSRPVELPDGTFQANFRTVTARAEAIGGGRVYFCDHKTPELVWRKEWQKHPNTSQSIAGFILVSERHKQEAETLAEMLQQPLNQRDGEVYIKIKGAELSVLSPSQYRARYEALASSMEARESIFGAMIIVVDRIDEIRTRAKNLNLPTRECEEQLTVRIPEFDCLLEFRAGG